MRSFITLSLLTSGAVAVWNAKACNGVGGCISGTTLTPDPFRCPDGTGLNLQQTAHADIGTWAGVYDIISKAEFPDHCLHGAKPGANDLLVVRTLDLGRKMYSFISETCGDKNPPVNCYSALPNPGSSTICLIVDSNGEEYVANPNAGQCERGSTMLNIPNPCQGWQIGMPDQPEQSF
ncbi:hypothetical protein COCCADRAFT_101025 [Bipolaris zeicola 26-R-13]|uniref:Uncharacterized protein n=1 Tax=Cochliobolus carbonum (strain 26-R-13) TaxID=930089 RepID=W6Y856_COCC2|nr:uncharacterized protein COCCADRAFT_101025 [Bipolaris zeicola 26-R-13]EUC31544.1 hypothetical protein COCCADRAFT_101025 [Bipolaris zeicola 26-R-13]